MYSFKVTKDNYELRQNFPQQGEGERGWIQQPHPHALFTNEYNDFQYADQDQNEWIHPQTQVLYQGPNQQFQTPGIVNEYQEREECCFKCTKITLMIIHVLSILLLSVSLVTFIYQLENGEIHLDGKSWFFGANVVFVLICEIIVLLAIFKENRMIILIYLVISIIGFIINLINFNYQGITIIFPLIVMVLSGYFAFSIKKKDRANV